MLKEAPVRVKGSLFMRLTVASLLLLSRSMGYAESATDPSAPFLQCAHDLCDETYAQVNTPKQAEAKKSVEQSAAKEFEASIRPLLDAWLAESEALLKKEVAVSADSIMDLLKAPLTPNETVINNLVWALSHEKLRALLDLAKPKASGNLVVDRAKAARVLDQLSPSEQAFLISYAEAIANTSEYAEVLFLSKNSYGTFITLKYPYQSRQAATQADGQRYLDMQNFLMSVDPKLNFLTSITKQVFADLSQGKEVVFNADTQWRFARARLNLALYSGVLSPGPLRELFLKRPVPFELGQIQAKHKKVLAQVKSLVLNDDQMQIRKRGVLAACLKSYTSSRVAALSETELNEARSKIGLIKAASEQVANTMVGSEKADLVKAVVEATQFLLPVSAAHLAGEYATAIQAMRRSDAQDAALIETPQWITRYGLDFPDTISDGFVFYSIKNLCANLQPSGFSDNALTSLGRISLSWPTIRYPGIGAGVIAHEIGHVISAAVANAPFSSFQQVRQCTVMRHLTPSNPVFANNTNYVEEDWADTFAARVVQRLSGSTSATGKNYACLFMTKSGGAFGPANEPLRLDDGAEADQHSSSLFRAMQLRVEVGTLPQSCEALAKSQGYRYFNRCGK
jgi:hypothetical protein